MQFIALDCKTGKNLVQTGLYLGVQFIKKPPKIGPHRLILALLTVCKMRTKIPVLKKLTELSNSMSSFGLKLRV